MSALHLAGIPWVGGMGGMSSRTSPDRETIRVCDVREKERSRLNLSLMVLQAVILLDGGDLSIS